MTTAVSKYHNRLPRYTLNTLDNSLIRYSGSERWPWEEKTEIKNISLSGLSFIAPNDLSPIIGEIIKIQFSVPGGEQMACYAVIIRIDPENEFSNVIAVHFYKLDRLQRLNLIQGLTEKLKIIEPKESQLLAKSLAAIGIILTAFSWYTLMKLYILK